MLLDPALIARLLGRAEQPFDLPADLLAGQTVLVTGAGGSIGSELCRALTATKCRSVVALDNHELGLLNLHGSYQRELLDLRNHAATTQLLQRHKPDVIIHTAAYKHLPLLEQFPFAAFENNTLVTARLASLSRELGVPRFLFLSSDKASNPVSILGFSKRLAELSLSGTNQVALRCANVLGSSGSVLSVWADQLAQGKALTVACQAERLFISPDEAVSILLALANAQDIHGLFAPAAASPVRVEDLATRFLGPDRASWPREPLALNSAEKEVESLCSTSESLQPTRLRHLLRIVGGSPDLTDMAEVFTTLEQACVLRDLPQLLQVADQALGR